MRPGPKRKPVFERFWDKVSADLNGGCWEWKGAVSGGNATGGYGQMRDAGKTLYAHRLSYETLSGSIPDGLHLDHLCRNRKCVNPLHLEPVTCKENLMRGIGPTSKHAAKTHCKQGHPYSGENLRMCNGSRRCRTCDRKSAAVSNVKKRHQFKGVTSGSLL